MINWTSLAIGVVIGIDLTSLGISLWNLCYRPIRRTNEPVITHKCCECEKITGHGGNNDCS